MELFQFESHEIRFVDGKPVANDVALALGYADPAKTVSTKVDSENKWVTKTVTQAGERSIVVLEEAGIYQLIFGSKLPSAKAFQKWVFTEVLPSIRKTGSYSEPPDLTNIDVIISVAQWLKQQELELKALKERADFTDDRIETIEMEVTANSMELERYSNGHGHWYTIAGFANLKGLKPDVKWCNLQGRKASAMCRQRNIKPTKVNDPRFGEVNCYPDSVLNEMIWA